MEVDVEVREVRSWEVKVLLRNEASVSDTLRGTRGADFCNILHN